MRPVNKAFHLPLALDHVKGNSLWLLAAEMLKTGEVHLAVSVLLFAPLMSIWNLIFILISFFKRQLFKKIISNCKLVPKIWGI